MPFHLQLDESDLLRCRFALSPLGETQAAVRVLAQPERHGYHLPWLRLIRDAAAGLELAPLWLLMARHGHSPDFFSPPPPGPVTTFEEEIAAVRSVDPEVARQDIALALANRPELLRSPPGRRCSPIPSGPPGTWPTCWNRPGRC